MAVSDTLRRMRQAFASSNMLMKIIWVNIAVFVLLRLTAIIGIFAGVPELINTVLGYVQLPSSPAVLITRPWTLLTYMFAQYDVLHIMFNLLWLYWFGTLFLMVATPRQMLALYIFGGLCGGVLFMVAYCGLPLFANHFGQLIGSSAAVIAIVTATAVLMPDFRMNLLFIGSVALKWIALATIFLVLIGVTGGNAGGEIAHIGGIIAGAVFAMQLKRGRDITAPFNRTIDRTVNLFGRMGSDFPTFGRRRKVGSETRPNSDCHAQPYTAQSNKSAPSCSRSDREILDSILDKIKKSGYSALTPEESRRLFEVSRKIK